jgi:hypothetical protein
MSDSETNLLKFDLGISNDLASLSAARELVSCHDNEVTLENSKVDIFVKFSVDKVSHFCRLAANYFYVLESRTPKSFSF